MSKIVVDTNVIVALLDKKDVHHARATGLVERIEAQQREIVLMDCILVELYSVIARRSQERGYNVSKAIKYIREIEETYQVIRAYDFRTTLHNKVLDLIIGTSGKLSYHDALIALVMQRKRMKRIATFDRDFFAIEWIEVEC